MRVLNNVPRIPMPDVATFQREYVARCQPVILTGAFDAQPIRKIDTLAAVRDAFGAIEVEVHEEYLSPVLSLVKDVPNFDQIPFDPPQRMSIASYLDLVAANPSSRLYIPGHPMQDMPVRFEPPAYFPEQPGDGILMKAFIANANNFAHLHFDYDNRQVLFYQVCGTKRVVMIPISRTHLLPTFGGYSSIFLEHFSDDDKYDFLKYVGAFDTLLHPGELLYMPVLIWHYLEYIDSGMSISIRYPRAAASRFLGDYIIMDALMQQIALKLAMEPDRPEHQAAFAQIRAAYLSETAPVARHRAVLRAAQELSGRLCPHHPAPYFLPHARLDELWVEAVIREYGRYPAIPLAMPE